MRNYITLAMLSVIVGVFVLIVAISKDIQFRTPTNNVQAMFEYIDNELESKTDYLGLYGIEVEEENTYNLTYMFIGHNEKMTVVIDNDNNITCYGSELLCDIVNNYINRFVM